MTDEAFGVLAAGRPAAATLDQLRRAQFGKHLLLLREIARSVPGPAFAELVAAEQADPAAVHRRLADPLFGAWATACLAALRRGETPEHAGVDHLADLLRPSAPGRWLRAEHDDLTIRVRLEDADPERARLGLAPTALTAEEAGRWQEIFTGAWRLLVTRHRMAAETLAAVLAVIVPVEPDPAAQGISATSADAYGAVAMSAPVDATALAAGLLHETAHSLLNAVQYLFDLHKHPGSRGYSPWRDDPRPPSGILHGAYAYLAVARFWRTEARTGDRLAAFEFARWREAVHDTATALLATGGLTPAGARFTEALRDEVRPWLDEPVPADVARLAAAANTDHHLRWRLRNLQVRPADTKALVIAWTQTSKPRIESIVAHLIPASSRALENSPRLTLTHSWLRETGKPPTPDGRGVGVAATSATAAETSGRGGTVGVEVRVTGRMAGGGASAADVAYLGGDYGAAADAYRKMIVENAGDDAAWAGLALVSRWERVEVVAAVYRRLDDPGVDLIALGDRISGAV